MQAYKDLSKEELLVLKEELLKKYEVLKSKNLKLDMSRGKPSPEQLDLSNELINALDNNDFLDKDGTDCRNYGVLDGIISAKELMASLLEVDVENILIYGNSSLNLMYDTISRAYMFGIMGNTPWCKLDKVKFLCVVPGYDRHFSITSSFGIENINIPMLEDGPDMDMIENLIKNDDTIKGIWCVPKYSNPSGNTYSDVVVKRFASLKPLAKDFRIYWDNAYIIHDLYEDKKDKLLNIFSECKLVNNENLIYEFTSTSKISFPGSGIAALASSKDNLSDIKKHMQIQTISHDKINQLRHVRYFKDITGLKKHMKKLATSLRPKFELVDDILNKELSDLGIATWTKPKGGYFISFDSLPFLATKIVNSLKEIGIVMTSAGATFPYGKDPEDKNIRIAPSYPDLSDLEEATMAFCLLVKLLTIEKILEN